MGKKQSDKRAQTMKARQRRKAVAPTRKAPLKRKRRTSVHEVHCESWADVEAALHAVAPTADHTIWYRGVRERWHQLEPSLMRDTIGLTEGDHDQMEQDMFFEFQARAAELRTRNLTDWEYLFYGRHYGVATRVMDWTDTFGIALYFAIEDWRDTDNGRPPSAAAEPVREPVIWVMRPTDLNQKTWDVDDIVLPRYLGLDDDDEFWDFGELLASDGEWAWDGPVAIYPVQLNDRVRAQRGWFTIHGNDRRPLDVQYSRLLTKIVLKRSCIEAAQRFLMLSGLNRFSIYPDLENLAGWIRAKNQDWAASRRTTR